MTMRRLALLDKKQQKLTNGITIFEPNFAPLATAPNLWVEVAATEKSILVMYRTELSVPLDSYTVAVIPDGVSDIPSIPLSFKDKYRFLNWMSLNGYVEDIETFLANVTNMQQLIANMLLIVGSDETTEHIATIDIGYRV